MENEKVTDDKEVIFYSALINAWINTRMERDKTLLILSSGGVGILITLFSTIGTINYITILIYFLAILSFIVSILSLVIIFQKNSAHIEESINGKRDVAPILDFLDKLSFFSFLIGAILATSVSIYSAFHIYNNKGDYGMGNSKSKASVAEKGSTKSLSGIGNLAPQKPSNSTNNSNSTSQSGSQNNKINGNNNPKTK